MAGKIIPDRPPAHTDTDRRAFFVPRKDSTVKNSQAMTLFAVVMLVYQGWRVFDYMSGSLQGVGDAVRIIVAFAFLAFSEIGLLVWLHVAKPHATTDTQETTATVLIWADFVGSMFVGLGDLIKHNTLYAVDLSVIDPFLFLAPWVMVVINVGGYLVYHQADSTAQLEQAERQLHHEEVKLEMAARREAIRELQNNKEALAAKLSPHYYREISNRVTGRTINRFERQAREEEGTPRLPAAPLQLDDGDEIIAARLNGVTHPNGHSRGGKA